MHKLYLILFTALILNSCGINKSLTDQDLYETKWSLKTLSGLSESENLTFSAAGLYFSKSDSTYSGSNGCNIIRGKFAISDNDVIFSEGISTKRACRGIDEQKFLSVLLKANRIKIKNGVLSLYDGKAKLADFERLD